MLFTPIMSKKRIYLYSGLILIALMTWVFSQPSKEQTDFSEKVKIALRDVGNKLLLTNKDTTSLILPVKEISRSKYELSFQSQLTFEPTALVSIVVESFKKAALPTDYRVEVIQCADGEVGYSYQITDSEESTIIPCAGRLLPKNCYTIQVRFTEIKASFYKVSTFIYIFLLMVLILMEVFFFKKKQVVKTIENHENYASLGSFQFYPTQNKLVKQATEISLSKKECELLQIFIANPNQIVTRDELTKKVWEDNGVIVGRSLDTYISKLRKILKDDKTIKLTNIHGVGYKLEIEV
ncbi:winged helix-turn-helix transcriptional regulator [Kordia sp. YSTF-M3]|uniref:Winged helix-turn-helix transcriptional regulator n=1 Tax=Kordia aestuariivivens TaxID=2759037 RepID=A0ABR7QEG4_9FLAO|nr:winged helix-turn-helix domain-containing protein [Kordia aestuariivivens]MBC8756961.1 winged helix-turn-helix transcriptional regulator [Kordia aestuariivivens]